MNDLSTGTLKDSFPEIQKAVGLLIRQINVTDKAVYIEFEDNRVLKLKQLQLCCEGRYFGSDDPLTDARGSILHDIALVGAGKTPVDKSEDDSQYNDHERAFIRIYTNNGVFVICAHNEHNGYYSGFYLMTEWLSIDRF